MFESSLPPVVSGRSRDLFTLACVWWCRTHVVLCFCFVCLRLVSCVLCTNVASFSGLSIFDCLWCSLVFIYSKIAKVEDSRFQIPFTALTTPYFCACPKISLPISEANTEVNAKDCYKYN